jgi:hypothetical protein
MRVSTSLVLEWLHSGAEAVEIRVEELKQRGMVHVGGLIGNDTSNGRCYCR